MKRGLVACLSVVGLLGVSPGVWAQDFAVRRVSDDQSVLDGQLGAELVDSSTGTSVQLADFSKLDEPGEYYLDVTGVGKSVPFRIASDAYDGELANVMLGFYGWRSGIDIDFERNGTHFSHAAGHLSDGLLDFVDGQVGKHKDGVGGWYDAGDYGKYLPTASESVVTMLAAWELFSDRLAKLSLPFIPEHGGKLPDYLSEVKWELDWLLKMTYDDGSGRVHHKLNSPQFPGFVLPVDDPTTRYFSTFSTAATGELVATFAKAARAFAPFDDVTDGYSVKLLDIAKTSYAYLIAHPDDVQYDSSVLSAGSYIKSDTADRLWAAAELWETTGDAEALAALESKINIGEKFAPNFDWDTTWNFALLTYALSQREGRDPKRLASLRAMLQGVANDLVTAHDQSGYGRDFAQYYWGTNGVVARTCMLLQSANQLEPNPAFLDVCTDQIGHLYGRNQYNRSYVTGSGVDPPLHPHHRLSGADDVDEPYPGLLVGGGQTNFGWKDQQSDFSSNEVAINWSSALVYALAGFIQGDGAAESLGRAPVAAASCNVRLNAIGYVPGRSKVATIQQDCDLPSAFQCAQPDVTLSGDTSGPRVLIDDIEDGDTSILANDGRKGAWYAYDDGTAGTRTDPEVKSIARGASKSAMCISGQGFTGYGGGIAFDLNDAGGDRELYDASAYTGFSFWARGLPVQFRAMVVDRYSDPAGGVCSGCYDPFQAPFTPTDAWEQYTFSWKDLKQQGYGDMQPNVCALQLFQIQFQWSGSAPFELCLDDVAFTTAAGTPAEGTGSTAPTPQALTAGGGCSCRSAGTSSGRGSALTLLALLALAAWRRKLVLQARARNLGFEADLHVATHAGHEREPQPTALEQRAKTGKNAALSSACAPEPPTAKTKCGGSLVCGSGPRCSRSAAKEFRKVRVGSKRASRRSRFSCSVGAAGPPTRECGKGKPVSSICDSRTPYARKRRTTRPLGAR